MKIGTTGMITIPEHLFRLSNLEKKGRVVFQKKGNKIYILPATEDNIEKCKVKFSVHLDPKNRISVRKAFKWLEVPMELIPFSTLELEGKNVVLKIPEMIGNVLKMSDKNCIVTMDEVEVENGKINLTLHISIDFMLG